MTPDDVDFLRTLSNGFLILGFVGFVGFLIAKLVELWIDKNDKL